MDQFSDPRSAQIVNKWVASNNVLKSIIMDNKNTRYLFEEDA